MLFIKSGYSEIEIATNFEKMHVIKTIAKKNQCVALYEIATLVAYVTTAKQ